MPFGCVVLTCPTVAFVLCLLAFSCLVPLHHIPHLCHVSSDVGKHKEGHVINFGQTVPFCLDSNRAHDAGCSEKGSDHLCPVYVSCRSTCTLCSVFEQDKTRVQPSFDTRRDLCLYQTKGH